MLSEDVPIVTVAENFEIKDKWNSTTQRKTPKKLKVGRLFVDLSKTYIDQNFKLHQPKRHERIWSIRWQLKVLKIRQIGLWKATAAQERKDPRQFWKGDCPNTRLGDFFYSAVKQVDFTNLTENCNEKLWPKNSITPPQFVNSYT